MDGETTTFTTTTAAIIVVLCGWHISHYPSQSCNDLGRVHTRSISVMKDSLFFFLLTSFITILKKVHIHFHKLPNPFTRKSIVVSLSPNEIFSSSFLCRLFHITIGRKEVMHNQILCVWRRELMVFLSLSLSSEYLS